MSQPYAYNGERKQDNINWLLCNKKLLFLLLWDILYSIAKKLHLDILKISFLYARPIYFAFVHFSKGLSSLASFC